MGKILTLSEASAVHRQQQANNIAAKLTGTKLDGVASAADKAEKALNSLAKLASVPQPAAASFASRYSDSARQSVYERYERYSKTDSSPAMRMVARLDPVGVSKFTHAIGLAYTGAMAFVSGMETAARAVYSFADKIGEGEARVARTKAFSGGDDRGAAFLERLGIDGQGAKAFLERLKDDPMARGMANRYGVDVAPGPYGTTDAARTMERFLTALRDKSDREQRQALRMLDREDLLPALKMPDRSWNTAMRGVREDSRGMENNDEAAAKWEQSKRNLDRSWERVLHRFSGVTDKMADTLDAVSITMEGRWMKELSPSWFLSGVPGFVARLGQSAGKQLKADEREEQSASAGEGIRQERPEPKASFWATIMEGKGVRGWLHPDRTKIAGRGDDDLAEKWKRFDRAEAEKPVIPDRKSLVERYGEEALSKRYGAVPDRYGEKAEQEAFWKANKEAGGGPMKDELAEATRDLAAIMAEMLKQGKVWGGGDRTQNAVPKSMFRGDMAIQMAELGAMPQGIV